MVFSEGKEDLEWGEMAKMAFDILLCCAEKAIQDMEICTMATAKLHALVSPFFIKEIEYLVLYWKNKIKLFLFFIVGYM